MHAILELLFNDKGHSFVQYAQMNGLCFIYFAELAAIGTAS
jgi:hypothetical protein